MKRVFAVLALGVLSACATPRELQRQADAFAFPPAPSKERVGVAVVKHFKENLNNPESAKFEVEYPPYKAYLSGKLTGDGMKWIGWAVDVGVSAKNVFGSTTPFYEWSVLLDAQGNVVDAFRTDSQGMFFHRME